MADEKINLESSIKFFVGLSTAGIGFTAAVAPHMAGFGLNRQLAVFGLISLLFFVGAIIGAVVFYQIAAEVDSIIDSEIARRRVEFLRNRVKWCSFCTLIGVSSLAGAGLVVYCKVAVLIDVKTAFAEGIAFPAVGVLLSTVPVVERALKRRRYGMLIYAMVISGAATVLAAMVLFRGHFIAIVVASVVMTLLVWRFVLPKVLGGAPEDRRQQKPPPPSS